MPSPTDSFLMDYFVKSRRVLYKKLDGNTAAENNCWCLTSAVYYILQSYHKDIILVYREQDQF
ncbi:MAG: hypothetical protein A2Y94_09190 [Caldithrix sp. RBG_13_44_9]|nr:MAG: hypothetical protein A2Y94_09190 [Caldithrix sp. RBG_13_44_9]